MCESGSIECNVIVAKRENVRSKKHTKTTLSVCNWTLYIGEHLSCCINAAILFVQTFEQDTSFSRVWPHHKYGPGSFIHCVIEFSFLVLKQCAFSIANFTHTYTSRASNEQGKWRESNIIRGLFKTWIWLVWPTTFIFGWEWKIFSRCNKRVKPNFPHFLYIRTIRGLHKRYKLDWKR